MNGKKAKQLKQIARDTGYPYKSLKKAYRVGAVTVKRKRGRDEQES